MYNLILLPLLALLSVGAKPIIKTRYAPTIIAAVPSPTPTVASHNKEYPKYHVPIQFNVTRDFKNQTNVQNRDGSYCASNRTEWAGNNTEWHAKGHHDDKKDKHDDKEDEHDDDEDEGCKEDWSDDDTHECKKNYPNHHVPSHYNRTQAPKNHTKGQNNDLSYGASNRTECHGNYTKGHHADKDDKEDKKDDDKKDKNNDKEDKDDDKKEKSDDKYDDEKDSGDDEKDDEEYDENWSYYKDKPN